MIQALDFQKSHQLPHLWTMSPLQAGRTPLNRTDGVAFYHGTTSNVTGNGTANWGVVLSTKMAHLVLSSLDRFYQQLEQLIS